MEKGTIHQIQKRVVKLLRKNINKPLYIISKDNCSELSRLVGCWIFKKLPNAKIYILKGDNVQNTKQSHDILAVEQDENIYLIDPSVWQFFKNKKSIFLKLTKTLESSLSEVTKIYGGKWAVSEAFKSENYNEKELKEIVVLNIKK